MQAQFTLAKWTRLAVSACLLAGGSFAHAQAPASTPPPGWVWQGVWQDGRWSGQWVPGAPGAPVVMPQGAYAPPPPPMTPDPETQRMIDHCLKHHHDGDAGDRDGRHARDRDCDVFFGVHPGYAGNPPIDPPGGPAGPLPYGPTPYGAMPMAPMGWMMVPVIQGPQAPCIETKTVTTEYVTERSHRVIRAKPHRKEKRVYTGN